MRIDFTRAKAKRESCFFYQKNPLCEKIGYKRPFLATCFSCHVYKPTDFHVAHRPSPIAYRLREHVPPPCVICGAPLSSASEKRCPGRCKNNLFAYMPPRHIIIEELRSEDLYGVQLT